MIRSVSVLRGRLRGLQIIVPVLRDQKLSLESKLREYKSDVQEIERQLSEMKDERKRILETKEATQKEVEYLRNRINTKIPSEEEVRALRERNVQKEEEVRDFEKSFDHLTTSSTALRENLESVERETRIRRKELIGALRTLKTEQERVCDHLTSELSFAIDREEKMMRLRNLERELFSLRDQQQQSAGLSTISEHTPLMNEDDIEVRQSALSDLHRKTQQALEILTGLIHRLEILEKQNVY